MKLFYHNDADGKCAAQVALPFLPADVELIAAEHGKPGLVDNVQTDEAVVMVDFSLCVDDMAALFSKTKDITWIDHHGKAMESLGAYADLKGLRSTDYSGCELAWVYYHKKFTGHSVAVDSEQMLLCPYYVKLVGDFDMHRFTYGDAGRHLQEMFRFLGEPEPNDTTAWHKLEYETAECVRKGELLLQYAKMLNRETVKRWSYETEFEGYKVLACNANVFSSDFFGELFEQYPFVIIYMHDGDTFKVSLRSHTMTVLPIAEKHGGGGHPKACSFRAYKLPFKRR